MATLFKRPGSPFWFTAFDVPLPDGTVRRLKKSTKKKVRSEAVKESVRLEELERTAAMGGGDLAAKAYSALAEAADAAAKGELSEARARQIMAKIAESSTGEKLRFYTIRSWAEEWLASKTAVCKGATGRRYKGSLSAFLNFLGAKGDSKLEAITKADLRAFRASIKEGRTAATVNFYMADVASMLRAAVRENLLLASPASALEKLPQDDSVERENFSVAEVASLIEAAAGQQWQDQVYSRDRNPEYAALRSSDWQGLILVGFYTGARLGDCSKLQWENVDLPQRRITFVPAKTSRKKKRLQIPIHPRLREFLSARCQPKATGPIFTTLHQRSVAGKTGLSGNFSAIAKAAGVDRRTMREAVRGKSGKVIKRSIQARSFHSLRHSLTSTLASFDVSEEIRMRIVGHQSAEVHQVYTHHELKTLAAAVEKLPNL